MVSWNTEREEGRPPQPQSDFDSIMKLMVYAVLVYSDRKWFEILSFLLYTYLQ